MLIWNTYMQHVVDNLEMGVHTRSKLNLQNKVMLCMTCLLPRLMFHQLFVVNSTSFNRGNDEACSEQNIEDNCQWTLDCWQHCYNERVKVDDIYEVRRRNNLWLKSISRKSLTHSNPALRDAPSYNTVVSSRIKRPKVALRDQYLGRQF